jgi:hypothetical protein
MDAKTDRLLALSALAQRWNRSETTLSMASALGIGPGYVKVHGRIMFSLDDIERFERACLYFDPAEVALLPIN